MAIDVLFREFIHNEQDYSSRRQAVQELGTLNNPDAIELLLVALQDPYYKIRAEAARSLGAYQDPRVIPPLIGALLDTPSVREAARTALDNMSIPDALQKRIHVFDDDDALRMHRAAIRNEAHFQPPIDYSIVHSACTSEDFAVREAAIFALAGSSQTQSLPVLLNALEDEVLSVREAAAQVVCTYSGAIPVERLGQLLQTAHVFVFNAVITLLRMHSAAALPPLMINLLQHSDITLRRRARRVLQQTDIDQDLRTLIDSLAEWDDRSRAVPAILATSFYREGQVEKASILGDAIQGCLGDVLVRDWPRGLEALRKLTSMREYRHLSYFCTVDFDKFDVTDLKHVLNETYMLLSQEDLTSAYLCKDHLTRFFSVHRKRV